MTSVKPKRRSCSLTIAALTNCGRAPTIETTGPFTRGIPAAKLRRAGTLTTAHTVRAPPHTLTRLAGDQTKAALGTAAHNRSRGDRYGSACVSRECRRRVVLHPAILALLPFENSY